MARAGDAHDWAPRALRGMIDSLYTPFSGPGGEQVDEHAFRALVTHCIGALDHDGVWVGGLVGEYWALTTQERKRLLEIAVDEIRTLKPDALIEACPASTNVLETVELARHAAATGADICFLIPPYFEARGYDSMREVLTYVTERTDIALGLFNTHAAGWILTPDECARLADEFPAICAVKNGMFRPSHTAALHRLAPELVIWECDMLAYRGGFLRRGIVERGNPRRLGVPLRATRQPALQRAMGPDRIRQALRGDRPLVRLGARRPRHQPAPGLRGIQRRVDLLTLGIGVQGRRRRARPAGRATTRARALHSRHSPTS